MNRDRRLMFERLRRAGHPPSDALAVVNAAAVCATCAGARHAARRPGDRGWCADCGRTWSFDPRTAITGRMPAMGGGA